jgi:hypothetical protein
MIKYVKGDCIAIAKEKESVIIPHIVNNIGAFGSGFVLALSREWPLSLGERSPEFVYRNSKCILGQTPICHAVIDKRIKITIANMCAQDGIMSKVNPKPIKYTSLIKCMSLVGTLAIDYKAEIVCPKFGSDRAGGNWNFIEELIEEIWQDIDVTVCSL